MVTDNVMKFQPPYYVTIGNARKNGVNCGL